MRREIERGREVEFGSSHRIDQRRVQPRPLPYQLEWIAPARCSGQTEDRGDGDIGWDRPIGTELFVQLGVSLFL